MRTSWLLVTIALVGSGGCKGKDTKGDEPAPAGSAPAPTAAAPAPAAPAPPPPAAAPASPPTAKACELVGPYKSASVKLTVSGNQTGTLDFVELSNVQTGTALDEDGVSFTFRTASGNEHLAFNLPCKTGVVKKSLGNAQLGTGTYIVGECTFDVKKLDKTGVEGTLDCPEQKNISNQKKPPVKLVGTFTLGT